MPAKDSGRACVDAMKELGGQIEALDSFYPMPKPVLVWQLLSYQNVTGVYSPFTIEANYNRDIPCFTLPFTICHELSHLTGYMREDEANFIGWLACASSGEAWLRYSGNLTAFITVGNALYGVDRDAWARVYGGLCPEAKTDLEYNNNYWSRFEGKVAQTHEKVNNSYLYNNKKWAIKTKILKYLGRFCFRCISDATEKEASLKCCKIFVFKFLI
jgi:hypothetical protein